MLLNPPVLSSDTKPSSRLTYLWCEPKWKASNSHCIWDNTAWPMPDCNFYERIDESVQNETPRGGNCNYWSNWVEEATSGSGTLCMRYRDKSVFFHCALSFKSAAPTKLFSSNVPFLGILFCVDKPCFGLTADRGCKLEILGSIVSRPAHYDACVNLSTLCKHGFFLARNMLSRSSCWGS